MKGEKQMRMIKLLDCTLRDGGYINDWRFGRDNIFSTIRELEASRAEILDIGFIRDEPFDENRTVCNSVEALSAFITNKKPGVLYAAMSEAFRPMPSELICERNETTVDVIRVIIWKDKHDKTGNVVDALKEGFDYCKMFSDKGYQLYVQPARVEQYSDEEFVGMLDLFSKLNPLAIYIVDSWGTMYGDGILHYLRLADKYLDKNIAIGFHGHNNLMQAFGNAVDFLKSGVERELIVDSSVFGIGRGAGNLHSEIIAKYMNEYEGKNYDVNAFWNIYEKCIKALRNQYSWGFNPAYYLTALYHANPQYGTYYGITKDINYIEIDKVLKNMTAEDRVLYTKDKAEMYYMVYHNT